MGGCPGSPLHKAQCCLYTPAPARKFGSSAGTEDGGMCCFSICASRAIFANFFSNGIGGSADHDTLDHLCAPVLDQKLKRYPRIILAIRWSVAPVTPTPRPKLISHCGAIFKSIAGKIWCCCCETASNPVTGPTEP